MIDYKIKAWRAKAKLKILWRKLKIPDFHTEAFMLTLEHQKNDRKRCELCTCEEKKTLKNISDI